MGAPGGLYRPTPGGTMVNYPSVGPCCLSLWRPSPPPTPGAHLRRAPPSSLVAVATPLTTWGWSRGRGNSAAVRRAITVATPRLIWLMADGTHGRGRPTLRSRLPRGPSSNPPAVFASLADQRGPFVLGPYRQADVGTGLCRRGDR